MREILFKAKRKDNGEWVEGCLILTEEKAYIVIDAETVSMDSESTDLYAIEWYEVDENTLCQYTGLTDKNGKKIWENDIVVYDNSPYNVYCTPKTGKIAFRNGCLCFKYWLYGSIGYMPFSADLFFDRKCEVLGNIFDNPELMKGEEHEAN